MARDSLNAAARLFFALYPQPSDRAALRDGLPDDLAARRVIPVDNLHVTLAFLGDIERERINGLCSIAGPVDVPAFDLHFSTLAHWGRARTRVLEPASVPPAADRLRAELTRLLATHAFPFDGRAWRPHITLARRALPTECALVSPVTVRFRDYVLMESRTMPEGAVYTPLMRWPLRPE